MSVDTIHGDKVFRGKISFVQAPGLPAGSINNAAIAAAAGIAATKLEHQFPVSHSQDDGTDIADRVFLPLHTVRGATAEIVGFECTPIDAPSGGDYSHACDLKKCNAGSPSPATVLSGTVDVDNSSADATPEVGTISSADLVDGDTIGISIATSGSSGVKGQGLIITVFLREDAA